MRDYSGIVMNLRLLAADLETAYGEERGSSLYSAAADAIEELLAKVPHWISVEERLPEKSKIVLVAYDNGVVAQGMLFFGKFRGANFGFDENDEPIIAEVTHWMPLPAPPKGVE